MFPIKIPFYTENCYVSANIEELNRYYLIMSPKKMTAKVLHKNSHFS